MEQEMIARPNNVQFPSSKELPRKDYESLDYDVCYNQPFSEMLKCKSALSVRGHNLMRWVVTFVIGVLTGLVAVFIDYFITMLSKWKFSVLDASLTKCTAEGCLAVSLLLLLLFNLSFTSIAGALTSLEPIAAGSGIPEIKCYLNGIKVPHVVRLKTLICKAVGVLFSVAGGLFVGKEGPMIHSGAIIGAGVPQSIAFRKIKFNFPYFRTDRDKRDFVSGGAAAGVAAAFGAPIGGVLFSLEEGSSFWNQALTWRSFFCSMASTFTLNFLLSGITGSGWGSFYQPGLLNFGVFKCDPNQGKSCDLWTIRDLLIFIAMGFVGGLLGAWFNALNKHLTVYRILHVQKRHKVVRVLEAILVALGTTCLTFLCPIYLGHCKTLPKDVSEDLLNGTKQYFCDVGQYNDMATLFFNNQERAIRQLFHWDDGFSLTSLWIFFICFYFLACWTYGASIPSGLFVPCLLCGASYGRFVGALLREIGYAKTYHGTFALIGAASFLGGVVRMTISLTVILIESTNEISYGLPLMITLMVAKFSGDLFNEGLYDIHIKLKRVPLLEWVAPEKFYKLRASDVMESCLSYVYPHTRVHSIVGILKTTAHNAFPVVTVDKDEPGASSDADYGGNPASANERYARRTTSSSLTSEQKTRGSSLILGSHELLDRQLNSSDDTLLASSAPPFQTAISNMEPTESTHSYAGQGFSQPSQAFPADLRSRACSLAEAKQTQTLTFHGIILRSQLVTLLKKRIFYQQNQGYKIQALDFAGMTEDYPRFPDIHDLHHSPADDYKIMDVTPYMNQCPYMISPSAPVPLVFNLFRTMGLRHLVVVNKKGQLVGMITRFNLTEEYMEFCLEKLEAQE